MRDGDCVWGLRQLVGPSRANWADRLHVLGDDDVLHDDALARTRHALRVLFLEQRPGAGGAVYLVDVNAGPVAGTTEWTAISANRDAVQRSPAGGRGRGQVELFIPQNIGLARSTAVTIAGW